MGPQSERLTEPGYPTSTESERSGVGNPGDADYPTSQERSGTRDPDEVERDIERTRERLGRDVDLLVEKVSPGQAARRGVDKVRNAAGSVRDAVMGRGGDSGHAAGNAASTVGDATSAAGDKVSAAGHKAAEAGHKAAELAGEGKDATAQAVGDVGRKVKRQTAGNPMAAGLIAFGVGWLISSLVPPSSVEEKAGASLRDAAAEPAQAAREKLSSVASDVADQLKEPARDAAESVKQTATAGAGHVKDEASTQARGVASDTGDAAGTVTDTAKSGNRSGPGVRLDQPL